MKRTYEVHVSLHATVPVLLEVEVAGDEEPHVSKAVFQLIQENREEIVKHY